MYEKRDVGIFLRLSGHERDEMTRAAERSNMSLQALIRFVMRKSLGLDTPCELEVPAMQAAAND